jgi:hypothetical protein
LWTSHRKKEYLVALTNAIDGIAQLMFLNAPFTIIAIAYYQAFVNPNHADVPIFLFSVLNILLLIFLFPTYIHWRRWWSYY